MCVVVWQGHRVRVAGDVLLQPSPSRSRRDMVTIRVIAEAIQRADTISGIADSLRWSAIGETPTVGLLTDDDGLLVLLHRRPLPGVTVRHHARRPRMTRGTRAVALTRAPAAAVDHPGGAACEMTERPSTSPSRATADGPRTVARGPFARFANRFRRIPDHPIRRTSAWRHLARRTVEV